MDLKSQFDKFLADIRLTTSQEAELRDAHRLLRERLNSHATMKGVIIGDFLQGSYRRKTATRPKNDNRADVDIVVVTTLSEAEYTPQQAMNVFVPFLNTHYAGKWEFQGRSIGITMSQVSLDVVVTSAPSEILAKALRAESIRSEAALDEEDWQPSLEWVPSAMRANSLQRAGQTPQWKLDPLRIPDRDAKEWDDTNPLEQIRFTWDKNRACSKHYVNVVKAVKWWRRINPEPKYPKGYPVEHLIGVCCPNGISSIAEGVTLALEEMVRRYEVDVALERIPVVSDHGVPAHNVLHRLTPADFKVFYEKLKPAAAIARQAFDSDSRETATQLWQKLFGTTFPLGPARGGNNEGGDDGGYSPRGGPTIIPTSGERWG